MKKIKTMVSVLMLLMALNSCTSNENNFVGVWRIKNDKNVYRPEIITISPLENNFLVNYEEGSGSFKEVGQVNGNIITINAYIKLSMINDTTLIMNNIEFIKSPIELEISRAKLLVESREISLRASIKSVAAVEQRITDLKRTKYSDLDEQLAAMDKRMAIEKRTVEFSNQSLLAAQEKLNFLISMQKSMQ